MKSSTLNFTHPARRVYTATKKAVQQCGQFKLSFGENVTIHVVATSTQETEVRIESASRIFLNFINGGANKKNVQSLEDYIRNEVHKLCSDEEIKLRR